MGDVPDWKVRGKHMVQVQVAKSHHYNPIEGYHIFASNLIPL